MRPWFSILIGVAFLGCMGRQDVVAESALRRLSRSDGDAGTAASSGCTDDASWLAIITKQGHIFRARPDSGDFDDLGIPDCLHHGGFTVAVDRSGAIWVQGDSAGRVQVIDPNTLACESLDLELGANAMAFVYDPATDSERLYALELVTLSVIDPKTLEKTVVGELDTRQLNQNEPTTRSLTGTSDGQLLVIYDGDEVGTAAVGRVDLGSAHITTVWPSIPLYSDALFVDGAVWGDDFALVSATSNGATADGGAAISRYHTATGQTSTSLLAAIDDSEPIAMGASTCAALR